jgi:hypothetical protein
VILVITNQSTKIKDTEKGFILSNLNVSTILNSDPTEKDRQSLSKTLYVFAWVVEGFAVLTGLFIALMIGLDTLEKIVGTKYADNQPPTTSDYINTIIAVLPFFLVAIVELAKIPVARATYKTVNKLWKTIFALTLVFLAIITFETSLNGFERNFSNLTFVIEKYKDELDSTVQNISELERQKVEAESLEASVIEGNYNKRRVELTTDRDMQVTVITNRIAELKSSVKTETTEMYRQELKTLQDELQQKRTAKNNEISRLTLQFEGQLTSVQSELDVKRTDIRNAIYQKNDVINRVNVEKNKALENAGLFDSETGIKREFNLRTQALGKERSILESKLSEMNLSIATNGISDTYNESLNSIESKYEKQFLEIQDAIKSKSSEISKSIALVEADIKTSVDSLYEQQKSVEDKFEQQLLANNIERKRQFDLLKNNQAFIEDINSQLTPLQVSRVAIRSNINQEVGTNQVYRITRSWTGAESSADITRSQVAKTAVIWFGSLAAVVALTGILLALASCVIADKKMTVINTKKTSAFSKLLFSVRKYYVYRQKRALEPKIREVHIEKEVVKEVIREVPVEKVVIKEVPKEIIRKQIVHVPMYTNDKDLVDKYNEASDLVDTEKSKLHSEDGS